MNADRNNLEEVLRTAHARRAAIEPTSAWIDGVLRSIHALAGRDDTRLWLWGAICSSSIAVAALLVAVEGDLWDSGIGSSWFNDPVGLISTAVFAT